MTAAQCPRRSPVAGRRRGAVTAMVAVLGCLLAAGPALASPKAPGQITGTDSVVGAPALKPGRWVDSYGPGTAATKHYLIDRRYPGSSLVVVASTPRGSDTLDTPKVSFDKPDGSTCFPSTDWGSDAGRAIARAASTSVQTSGIDPEEDCVTQSRLLVTIESPEQAPPQPTPMEIMVTEIPAARQATALPEPLETHRWKAPPNDSSGEEVTGGSGAEPGPLLQHGTYQSTISRGQVLRYQVRADWGQVVSTTTSLTANVPSGSDGPELWTDILGPNGTPATVSTDGGPTNSRTLYGDDTVQVGTQTAPVRYRNLAGPGGAFGASQPGTYTIVVGMDGGDVAGPIPFLLQVGVHGGRAAAPEFADGQQIDTGGYDDPEVNAPTAEQGKDGKAAAGKGGDTRTGEQAADEAGPFGMPRWLLVGGLVLVGGAAILTALLIALAARRPRR